MRYTLLALGFAALVLPACASKPAPTDRAANTTQTKEKPKYITMEQMYESRDDKMMQGPGLFSGETGYMTIYSKEAPGSSDPSKPVKVPRERR